MAVYSHSRLTSFQRCPKKFLWRYTWNVDPRIDGVEAFTGKRVHETLESVYAQVLEGRSPPSLQSILAEYHGLWDGAWTESVRIVARATPDDYRRMGERCLEGYHSRHFPFAAGTTLAVERRFEVPLGEHRLRGILDRVDIGEDGAIEVHDYKTGKRTPGQRALEADLQVGLYELAARQLYPERRQIRMIWHYLQSGAERRMEGRRPDSVRSLRRTTVERIDLIEGRTETYRTSLDLESMRELSRANRGGSLDSVPGAARRDAPLFPARVSPLCKWCSFLDWCPEGSRYAGQAFRPPAPPRLPAPPAPQTPQAKDPRQTSLF